MKWLLLLAVLTPTIALAEEEDEGMSKKALFLKEKEERPVRRAQAAPKVGTRATPVITVRNVWTHESLPVPMIAPKTAVTSFDDLTRCHHTNQTASMDARLFDVIVRAAQKFHSSYVEVVSGFRAPKYQLMLRKKGHEVARDSEHPRGHAVDFRLPNVKTKQLLRFVKSLHIGGVGYYPESKFVHADVGRIRFWKGH